MEADYYLLDSNIASFIIKGHPKEVRQHLLTVPIGSVFISAITEAELRRGVERKPLAKTLAAAVEAFLLRVEILAWDSKAAKAYARLRTLSEKAGITLGTMDMLIAAHTMSVGAILVTHDKAFFHLSSHIKCVDWTQRTI